MIFDQRDHTFVIRTVGVMEIRFVDQNHCVRRSFGDEIAQIVLWRDARRWIVRVADVNQTFAVRGRAHFLEIMRKAAG